MDNGEKREGDFRVPLIYGLFFISCLTGGIILALWLLDAKGSQPWFPILALVLIGFPWIFWLLIFCYSIITKCFTRGDGDVGSRRISSNRTMPEANVKEDLGSPPEPSPDSSDRRRKVKFGPVVVMGGSESLIASDRESEMPLNRPLSS